MQDINYQLRQSYYSLLQGNIFIRNIIVPCFYLQAPAGAPATPVPNCYILFNPITSTEFKDFLRDNTLTNFNILIVTKFQANNDGSDADNIAQQIFNIIQPGPGAQIISITNGQVVSTTLTQDRTFGMLQDGSNKVVNRSITFTHKVVHYPFSQNAGTVYLFVQDNNDTPVDWSNSIQTNPAQPISANFGSQPSPKFFGIAYLNTYAAKENFQDLNQPLNGGSIGGQTDLFAVSVITHNAQDYVLIMANYATSFNGLDTAVKFF